MPDEAIFLSASLFSVLLMSLALIYGLFNISDLLKVGFIYFFSRSPYLNNRRQFKQDNVPETEFYKIRSAQNAHLVVPLLKLV